MSMTHFEIVKVWIAPDCIVCDICEDACPEVFDVQEDTCVIRPEAMRAAFTQPLTAAIEEAAKDCPAEVIKFEMIEVAGPEPWASKVSPAAPDNAVGAAAASRSSWSPPVGPVAPKWAKLLGATHVSGSRSAGGPGAKVRPCSYESSETVAMILDRDAPPDAIDAVRVGAGFVSPQLSMAQRIRAKASRAAALSRRGFSTALAVGWTSLALAGAAFAGSINAFMAPRISKEPLSLFRAGRLAEFAQPGVYEQHKDRNVWLVHLPDDKLVALSTTCTHLGCIPIWLANDAKFKCPCHGSGFYMNGVNFEGPAPRSLERHRIFLEGDVVVVDKSIKYREELGQWASVESFVAV